MQKSCLDQSKKESKNAHPTIQNLENTFCNFPFQKLKNLDVEY